MSTVFGILGGLALLALGGWGLVSGASRLAALAGVKPLLIGLTVVAFGTSAPEMAVSLHAGLAGSGDIALGNIVGSNILNVLLVLGATALAAPLTLKPELLRLDVPIMVGVSALACFLALDGTVSRVDGGLLFAGLLGYLALSAVAGRRKNLAGLPAPRVRAGPWEWSGRGGQVLLGLGLLVLGARFLVDGAAAAARHLGMSELVIGLTVVAAGTSMPEVVTSIVAAARGERDIAIGNVVGSNLFNLLGVLGVTAALTPAGVPASAGLRTFDLPVMLAVAVLCLPVFSRRLRLGRTEGALFLLYYAVYTGYLVLESLSPAAFPVYEKAVLWGVLPLTLVPLGIACVRSWIQARKGRRPASSSPGNPGSGRT
jgi:cation:H+ antiporter